MKMNRVSSQTPQTLNYHNEKYLNISSIDDMNVGIYYYTVRIMWTIKQETGYSYKIEIFI